MKNILTVGSIFLLLGCTKPAGNVSMTIPAEFEPQDAIWLGLASAEEGGYDSTTIQMIKALNGNTNLKLLVENDSLFPDGEMFFHRLGLDTSTIELIRLSPMDIWVRDPGPVFGRTSDGSLALADFKYTNYANVPQDSISTVAKEMEGIDRAIASALHIPTIESQVAIEGGAFETNGKGALIQVENITLKRNPHLTKEQIEKDYREHFNMTDILWLPSGVVDDPHNFDRIKDNVFGFGTGGHTDEFVRFANDSTILLAWVDEKERDSHIINTLNYEVLSEAYEILKNYAKKDGTHFKIVKVPHPTPHTYEAVVSANFPGPKTKARLALHDGDSITMAYSSSYLNYLISDKVILLPQYGSSSQPESQEKDNQVRKIFEQLYPGRKIIGINPLELNSHGGGMHCRYQSQPKL